MSKVGLNRAIENLLSDKRLLSRFRKNPEAALADYDVTTAEVEAVVRGDDHELFHMGLDQSYVSPKPLSRGWISTTMLKTIGKIAAPVALALAIALWPTATGSAEAASPKARVRIRSLRRVRTTGLRRSARRVRAGHASARARARMKGFRASGVRSGLRMSLRRVGGSVCGDEKCSIGKDIATD